MLLMHCMSPKLARLGRIDRLEIMAADWGEAAACASRT